MNQVAPTPESYQQQHYDFIRKYKAGKFPWIFIKPADLSCDLAKAKLESQLEAARAQEIANGCQASDILKRVSRVFFLETQFNVSPSVIL